MTPRETFLCLIASDAPRASDAIILLEGDGLARIPKAEQLYGDHLAPLVVISGGIDAKPRSIPAREMLAASGMPHGAVLLEEASRNTREQAVAIMRLAREHGWGSLIIVGSDYHQYRAFLTFLQAMREASLSLSLYNAPAHLPWFEELGFGKPIALLEGEFERIEQYRLSGHIASYEDAIDYFSWRESRP